MKFKKTLISVLLLCLISISAAILFTACNKGGNHVHTYFVAGTVPATCTEQGQTIYRCTECGVDLIKFTEELGHDLQMHEAKPNCTQAGCDAYETCSRCDYTTYNKLAAIGEHDYVNGFCTRCKKEKTSEGLIYTYNFDLNGDYYSVTGLGECTDTEIIIDNEYNGLPVKMIAERAFYNTVIESVKIPEGVTTIGEAAFSWCINLTSVTIPNSVTTIGGMAFYNCGSIERATLPMHAVSSIPKDVLKTVVITNGTAIGVRAFLNYVNLKSVTLPDNVKTIGDYAFQNCTSLDNIILPHGVTAIGERAFSGCTALQSVTIPSSVTAIGAHAFYYCTGLESVTIPGKVAAIGNNAFSWCTGLKNLTISNGVISIGTAAFYNCTGLESVAIPESVTSIGNNAFAYTGLTSAIFTNTSGWECNGTALAETDLSDAATAATYLTSTYCAYLWSRK